MNHKETVSTFIEEAINKGNFNVIEDLIHQDYSYTSPTETMQGQSALKHFISSLRLAFPDLATRVLEQIGENETICTRVRMTGTHCGDFLGLPATKRIVDIQGIIISRILDGRIVSEWELLDQLTLLQQLGIAPVESAH